MRIASSRRFRGCRPNAPPQDRGKTSGATMPSAGTDWNSDRIRAVSAGRAAARPGNAPATGPAPAHGAISCHAGAARCHGRDRRRESRKSLAKTSRPRLGVMRISASGKWRAIAPPFPPYRSRYGCDAARPALPAARERPARGRNRTGAGTPHRTAQPDLPVPRPKLQMAFLSLALEIRRAVGVKRAVVHQPDLGLGQGAGALRALQRMRLVIAEFQQPPGPLAKLGQPGAASATGVRARPSARFPRAAVIGHRGMDDAPARLGRGGVTSARPVRPLTPEARRCAGPPRRHGAWPRRR